MQEARPTDNPAAARAGRLKSAVDALPWLALAIGLALTLWSWDVLREKAAQDTRTRFQYRTEQIENALRTRLQAYRLTLQGGAALFSSSDRVTRDEWRTYVASLDLRGNLPGIQGMGYARRVDAGERDRLIRQIRAEGHPAFTIWPGGERADCTSIVYIEPFRDRNLRAFGYDMYSEPVRRAAMDRARDTGQPSLSGKVLLLQETGQDVQAGFIIYVPVYRHGQPLDTIAQRRAALEGWVYAPFRMGDFMAGLLGPGPVLQNDIDLEIFDGDGFSAKTLMWDYDNSQRWLHNRPNELGEHRVIHTDGHAWTLHMVAMPAFANHSQDWKPRLALVVGVIGSLLIFALMKTLASTRRRALDLATEMTSALAASEERYRQIFLANQAVKLVIDPADGRIVDANTAAASYYGYPLERLLAMKISDINTMAPEAIAHEMELARQEKRVHFYFHHRLANGEVRDVEVYSGPVDIGGRRLLYSIVHDITERARIQAEQRAILATALVGLAHVRERRWIWVNTGMERMFGYRLDELRGADTATLYASHDDYERIGREAYPLLLGGGNYESPILMRRKDGATFWCQLSGGMVDPARPELGSIWTFKDIDDFVAAQTELSALNAQLLELSLHDPLTGLYNRRHLENVIERELMLAERKGRKLALIMFDIDYFKRVNDRFGHDTGDDVLRAIAHLVTSQVRETDIACRYGGEEFVILMPETDLAIAMRRAESLRIACESLRLARDGQDLGRITLSLGVAIYPDHAGNGPVLITAADSALYRAKQGGRNRVECAQT